MIDTKMLESLRSYIQRKTGILYFKHIKLTRDNIMVTCPFHKKGQESKPSAGIRITEDAYSPVGMLHCFTCGETMTLSQVVKELLGPLYDEDEVEKLFQLKLLDIESKLAKPVHKDAFIIPQPKHKNEPTLRKYRYYHPYLEQRNITEDVAKIYDIGYDTTNNQITFPLRDRNRNCLGIGRRSVDKKQYRYPTGMIKPVYGIYELSEFLRYVFVCEGPFNLWSLKGWGKEGVALLGTGTEHQYKELLKIQCEGFVLALDPDDAGMNGTYKLGNFLIKHNRKVFVSLIPTGKDINDLTQDEFKQVQVITFGEWLNLNRGRIGV